MLSSGGCRPGQGALSSDLAKPKGCAIGQQLFFLWLVVSFRSVFCCLSSAGRVRPFVFANAKWCPFCCINGASSCDTVRNRSRERAATTSSSDDIYASLPAAHCKVYGSLWWQDGPPCTGRFEKFTFVFDPSKGWFKYVSSTSLCSSCFFVVFVPGREGDKCKQICCLSFISVSVFSLSKNTWQCRFCPVPDTGMLPPPEYAGPAAPNVGLDGLFSPTAPYRSSAQSLIFCFLNFESHPGFFLRKSCLGIFEFSVVPGNCIRPPEQSDPSRWTVRSIQMDGQIHLWINFSMVCPKGGVHIVGRKWLKEAGRDQSRKVSWRGSFEHQPA